MKVSWSIDIVNNVPNNTYPPANACSPAVQLEADMTTNTALGFHTRETPEKTSYRERQSPFRRKEAIQDDNECKGKKLRIQKKE